MQSFPDFIHALDSLDWTRLPTTFGHVEKILEELYRNVRVLSEELGMMGPGELEQRVDLSHETTTHFKWYMHKSIVPRYTVWLHDYKEKTLRRPGYAEVPHNHRYWFSSLVLLGGFKHHVYNVELSEDPDSFRDIIESYSASYRSGTVYTVNPDMIHSISEIEEPTLTLIIRGKGIKPHSQTFDPATGKITRYLPFSSRLANLKNVLSLI